MTTTESQELDLPIKHVTSTAWAVAAMRLAESRAPDAKFNDELSAKLLAGYEDQLAEMKLNAGQDDRWMQVVQTYIVGRTYLIDHAIERLVREEGVDTVFNIGAGLDTRPYRLKLPKSLRWFEADYASTIALKNTRLSADHPACELHRIEADLAQNEERARVLDTVTKGAKKILVLTEGLLPYLPEVSVIELTKELHALKECRYWMMDHAGASFYSWTIKSARARMASSITESNNRVSLPFRPESVIDFMAKHDWSLYENTTLFEAAEQMGRLRPDFTQDGVSAHNALKSCGVATFNPA